MDTFASMEIDKGKWARVMSACDWKAAGQYGSSTMFSEVTVLWLRVPVLSQLLCSAANLWFIFFQTVRSKTPLATARFPLKQLVLMSIQHWAWGHRLIPKAQSAWGWQEQGGSNLPLLCPLHSHLSLPDAFSANSRLNPTSKSSFQYTVQQIFKLPMVNHYNKLHILYSSLCFCLLNTWMFTITAQDFCECQIS